jgi:putative ABC transport system permease protein
VTASLMVIVVSVLASLQPAFKASRMEPIDALRHV